VRLPLSQRIRAWLRDYWRGGTAGARVLLGGSVAATVLLLGLVLLQPGPCIAVLSPVVRTEVETRAPLADAGTLHARLTRLLKQLAPQATVLGRGVASDSRLRLSARGAWDVCVARRRVALEVSCTAQRCLLDLHGERVGQSLHRQLWLPLEVDPRRLEAALEQLLRAQQRFLLR
jgi:hypothetical protein